MVTKKAEKEKEKEKETDKEKDIRGFCLTEAEAAQLMRDQSDVLDYAEHCGFKMTGKTEDDLIDALGIYGKDGVMAALDACSAHNALTISYMRGCLTGKKRTEDDQSGDYSWMGEAVRKVGV